MIQDNDKLHGVVEIVIALTDTRGRRHLSTAIVARGYTLSDVGTVLQRETYELLRRVADGQSEAEETKDQRAQLAAILANATKKVPGA